ncbi:MAG TPA: hypothetical protein VFX73_03675 [Chitinophagaceae bacterium]|jgi:hypothetical protein|nr:hypothetical protein [Chitinophagaceae bacterium]
MKKISLLIVMSIVLFACQNASTEAEKPAEETAAAAEPKSTVEMPYTASYSSNFTTDVSDKDLKMVLDSYKYWETGDMKSLAAVMGDSVVYDNSSGVEKTYSNAELMKMWQASRDSLSNIKIDVVAYHKMKSDKGHQFIVVWYNETDSYKIGKVDSTERHDINAVDSTGRIVRYSQYTKPKTK